jgi:hypothetical protein
MVRPPTATTAVAIVVTTMPIGLVIAAHAAFAASFSTPKPVPVDNATSKT